MGQAVEVRKATLRLILNFELRHLAPALKSCGSIFCNFSQSLLSACTPVESSLKLQIIFVLAVCCALLTAEVPIKNCQVPALLW